MNTEQDTSDTREDPLVDEIRRVKESISLGFEHDVVKLCRELSREQQTSGRRLIRRTQANPAPASLEAPDRR